MQLVDDKAVFVSVSDANAHHSELESVSPTDRHGRDGIDFCILSSCDQLVRCPTHTAGNRLDLMLTDVPDIVDNGRWYSTGHFRSLLCQLCASC